MKWLSVAGLLAGGLTLILVVSAFGQPRTETTVPMSFPDDMLPKITAAKDAYNARTGQSLNRREYLRLMAIRAVQHEIAQERERVASAQRAAADAADAVGWSVCGNGIPEYNEECDLGAGNADTPDTCRVTCRNPRCGDGIVDTGEQCDDGNNGDGDGCNSVCEIEVSTTSVPPTTTTTLP